MIVQFGQTISILKMTRSKTETLRIRFSFCLHASPLLFRESSTIFSAKNEIADNVSRDPDFVYLSVNLPVNFALLAHRSQLPAPYVELHSSMWLRATSENIHNRHCELQFAESRKPMKTLNSVERLKMTR